MNQQLALPGADDIHSGVFKAVIRNVAGAVSLHVGGCQAGARMKSAIDPPTSVWNSASRSALSPAVARRAHSRSAHAASRWKGRRSPWLCRTCVWLGAAIKPKWLILMALPWGIEPQFSP
jgi:hypothetical protein